MPQQRFSIEPVVVSGLLHSLSQGILFTQAGAYSATCNEDSIKLKCFVAFVSIVAFTQTVLQISKLWIVAVFEQSWNSKPVAWLEVFANGLVCTFVEGFLILRCWKVTGKNKLILSALSVLAISTFVSNVLLAVRFHDVVARPTTLSHLDVVRGHIAFSYWMFGSLALDLSITLILLVFLLRSRTGLEHLDAVVNRIIHITWETASLPAIFMVISVSIFLSDVGKSQTELVLLFMCLTGKLYCHGFLRSLNARQALKEELHDHKLVRNTVTTIGGTPAVTTIYKPGKKRRPRSTGSDNIVVRRTSLESSSIAGSTVVGDANGRRIESSVMRRPEDVCSDDNV